MFNYKYIGIALVLNLSWFFMVFFTLEVGRLLIYFISIWFGYGYSNLFYLVYLFLILYLLIIVYFHIKFLVRKQYPIKTKVISVSIVLLITYVIAKSFSYWWYEVPPVSEARAVEIAKESMKDVLFIYLEPTVQWDMINHEWIVRFKEKDANNCESVKISRTMTYTAGGSCPEQ